MLAVSVPAGISTLVVDEGLAVPTNTYAPVDTFVMLKKTLDVFAVALGVNPLKFTVSGALGFRPCNPLKEAVVSDGVLPKALNA